MQLVQLVNDLLEIARSEAKTMTIKTVPLLVTPIVEQVIESLKPIAVQKGLTLKHTPNSHPVEVLADPDRIKEILNNLVSNAVKYSNQGMVSISHVVEKDVLITHVADQGAGISESDQKKIFTRFFRAEVTAGTAPGTGLGLFIVKQLVEKMHGRIWFTSKLGSGTTFSFSLPLAGKTHHVTHQDNSETKTSEKTPAIPTTAPIITHEDHASLN
jgi:signal transduction histidine kinase